jgi:DNA primase
MGPSVEALKQVNLVEFLRQHYGLVFQRRGAAFACCSPFTGESSPSLFVRQVGGHWVFKDFSGGGGGSIFDFVQIKENLGSFSEALSFVRRLLSGSSLCEGQPSEGEGAVGSESMASSDGGYDVEVLYERFRQEDPEVCRRYLLERGIDTDLVEAMIGDGTVVHNRHGGRSWCTFAVRDEVGQLKCLDNHAVDGKGKFVLGKKNPFSLEWEELQRAKVVFLAEGIIDYLSVKTLERTPPPGMALLGNQLCFERSVLERAEVVLSAMDDDRGGDSAVLDLQCLYPEQEVRIYDLEGYKDPNELLMAVRSGKGRRLSPERKIELYREFQQSKNKADLAARWGIDRSHLYEIVRDCESALAGALASRKPGRPPKGKPATLAEALERIEELETQYEQEATRREEEYCRSELLALRLKWAEIEAAEARGEKVDESKGPEKKGHVKKKKKRKPFRR